MPQRDVSNRSLGDGGEDNIAVFSLDPASGEPSLIQNAPAGSIHVRTFSIHDNGRLLVAASTKANVMPRTSGAEVVPAALSVFLIRENGLLDFVRKYAVDNGTYEQFWNGVA